MKKINFILMIAIVVIVINSIFPNYSYGISGKTVQTIGGKLLSPVMDLLVALCDGAIDISQKVLFGVEGDAIVEVDRVGSWIAKGLAVIASLAVIAGCVALAVFFAPVTGVVATIAVGVGTAVLSIGKAIKTYFAVSVIVSSMLNNMFQLPFIVISPESIIQNKIGMFSVNFFEENTNEQDTSISISDDLHAIIAKWYYAIRNLVIVLFMIVLLYIGIRIILTSISEEKAKYKQMLIDWFVSFCLLFVIHYIMIFSMFIVDEFTKMLSSITNDESVEYFDIVDDKVYDYVKENLVDEEDKPSWFNEKLEQMKGSLGISTGGTEEYSMIYINEDGKKTVRFPVDNFLSQARIKFQLLDKDTSTETYVSVGWKIIYVMLTLYTLRFSWIYLKRVVYIAFLIIIAPLVVLTYSIDKFKDGDAQGFNTWLREYLFNLAIQPLHLILYTVFVGSAMSLASKSPIYVVVVLGFIIPAEKILRNMFGFQKASTPGVLGGAIGTGIAMNAMQNIFGKKPPRPLNSNNIKNVGQATDGGDSRIKEQNIDEAVKGMVDDDETKPMSIEGFTKSDKDYKQDKEDKEEKDEEEKDEDNAMTLATTVGGTMQNFPERLLGNNGSAVISNEVYNAETGKKVQRNNKVKIDNPKRKKKRKAKLKLGRALKGAGRHYVQTKGKQLANRTLNTDWVGGVKRMTLGGVAALTAGTAGVMLGATDGDISKAFRNAGVAGTAAYKGVSNIVGSRKIEGISEAFSKSGYGDEYKQHENEKLAKEIKRDLENHQTLKDELDWDDVEIKKFMNKTIEEYIDSGVKQFDDMLIGEKLKIDGIVQNTKEAIGVMAMGQKIGTDTTKLTSKKKQEWAETFMKRNDTMSNMQKELDKRQKEYDKRIEAVVNKKLDGNEEKKLINEINQEKDKDKTFNSLKSNIKAFEVKTFEKLDKYSEYKYK